MALLEQRRRTSESEQKRLVAMGQMISAEKAIVLFTAIGDAIRLEVLDPDVLQRLSMRLAGLMDGPGMTRPSKAIYQPEDISDVDPRNNSH